MFKQCCQPALPFLLEVTFGSSLANWMPVTNQSCHKSCLPASELYSVSELSEETGSSILTDFLIEFPRLIEKSTLSYRTRMGRLFWSTFEFVDDSEDVELLRMSSVRCSCTAACTTNLPGILSSLKNPDQGCNKQSNCYNLGQNFRSNYIREKGLINVPQPK